MSEYCEDCGCRVYGGICSNCREELYIYEYQNEGQEFSKGFLDKVGEQRKES